jgi:hypothetical protein
MNDNETVKVSEVECRQCVGVLQREGIHSTADFR